MLLEEKMFDKVEQMLEEDGTMEEFRADGGDAVCRMMITGGEVPEQLELEQKENVAAFFCSFDVIDTILGIAYDTKELKPVSGIFSAPQKEGAQEPDGELGAFFVQLVDENIGPEGKCPLPMFIWVNEGGPLVILPEE